MQNHDGGLGGGHYTTFAKYHQTGEWYKFNDAQVSKIDPSQLITPSAYLLFYQKRKAIE